MTQMSTQKKHPKTNCWNFPRQFPDVALLNQGFCQRDGLGLPRVLRGENLNHHLGVDCDICEFIGWKYRKKSSTTLISSSKSLWEIHGRSDFCWKNVSKQIFGVSREVDIGFTNMYLGRFLRGPVSLTQECQWAFWLERVALGINGTAFYGPDPLMREQGIYIYMFLYRYIT